MNMNLITAQQQSKQNPIVIFSWDDTLFPTTAFFKQQQNEKENIHHADLTKLSKKVLNLLNKYCSLYGEENVFIVTNGGKHWILQSLKYIITYCMKNEIENSFNSIYSLLINGKITSISANHLYSKRYPKKPILWKYLSFHSIVYNKFLNSKNPQFTFISIGDSIDEHIASKNIVKDIKNRYDINITLHRLKLIKTPTINTLNEQFGLITSLGTIFQQKSHDTDIDYQAEIRKYRKNRQIF